MIYVDPIYTAFCHQTRPFKTADWVYMVWKELLKPIHSYNHLNRFYPKHNIQPVMFTKGGGTYDRWYDRPIRHGSYLRNMSHVYACVV